MEYYFQIKGKTIELGKWAFPPMYSNKIKATDKQHAHVLINELFKEQFPLRVLRKDTKDHNYLLSIEEITDDCHHIKRLFVVNECPYCGNPFRIIDKYNDHNCTDKSPTYCSQQCKEADNRNSLHLKDAIVYGGKKPIIYKITNTAVNQCYIGKTTQAFTLRWYQHVFQGSDNKFHTALKNTPITQWTFEVIEVIEIPEEYKYNSDEINRHISEIEGKWIRHYNSIINGYNSATVGKESALDLFS